MAIHGGIGLSMERLNKILSIDESNLQVTTEPAVITQVLREAVAEKDCFILLIQTVWEVALLEEILLKILGSKNS